MASSHGIYRGGLGVHLALVAMAGDLGMDIDLGVPAEAPTGMMTVCFLNPRADLSSLDPKHRERLNR